jgi:hypothetical protein
MQLATAFRRSAAHKISMGSTKSQAELINESITLYNKSTVSNNCKVTGDERKAVKMLITQTPEFLNTIQMA